MQFLFDLGGVFFDWDPKFYYKNIINEPEELDTFLNEICSDEWNFKQDAGRTIEEAENELIVKFPKYESKIKLYYRNHRKMIKGIYLESIEVLNELKLNNYSCYVLSNWSAETFEGMEDDYPFLKKFDGLIISGREKLVKPSLDIYKLAIKRFNLFPEKTVFIDDKFENIEAAKKLQFKTIHLTNPENIKALIQAYI